MTKKNYSVLLLTVDSLRPTTINSTEATRTQKDEQYKVVAMLNPSIKYPTTIGELSLETEFMLLVIPIR